MLGILIEKELRERIRSRAFAVTFGVCAVLIVLTFYIGACHYQVSVERWQAAQSENLRKMEGLTDWLRVEHHIYLPPDPLSALVTGITNDVGRTIEMYGRGELTAEGSRYGEDPIYAVFRFLDLDFAFQVILSLFAVLLAFNAVSGEKEQGTLRLAMANAVPRSTFILGKLAGTFLALGLPLLIPILLGCLLLMLMGVPLGGSDWARLALVIAAGLLYFGAFLGGAVWVSSLTHRATSAFLILLIIWVVTVLMLPRAAVLLSGRAVDVLSVDEIAARKSALSAQLWAEDQQKMAAFKPGQSADVDAVMKEFNDFMQERSAEREARMRELSDRLNEERRNGARQREQLALNLARISPAAVFSLAATTLAGSGLGLKDRFLAAADGYQESYARFMSEKTGGVLRGGGMVFITRRIDDSGPPPPIDPTEIPAFEMRPLAAGDVVGAALPDLLFLLLANVITFAGAVFAFLRYDVR